MLLGCGWRTLGANLERSALRNVEEGAEQAPEGTTGTYQGTSQEPVGLFKCGIMRGKMWEVRPPIVPVKDVMGERESQAPLGRANDQN